VAISTSTIFLQNLYCTNDIQSIGEDEVESIGVQLANQNDSHNHCSADTPQGFVQLTEIGILAHHGRFTHSKPFTHFCGGDVPSTTYLVQENKQSPIDFLQNLTRLRHKIYYRIESVRNNKTPLSQPIKMEVLSAWKIPSEYQ
jgi:hypothetical protein